MSLTAADVAEIMRLVEQSSFDELTLEVAGMKLTLRRNGAGPVVEARPAASEDSAPVSRTTPDSSPVVARGDPNAQDVTAPMLGTFYRSPKPGAPPFVEVGASVEEDTVVAIIEFITEPVPP